jgi:hypothetical protein
MSELVIILILFVAIIFMYATGLMGGIPKLLKLVEQEDFDTFEFDCKKHKVAYEALLEHEEGDDLKIDLLFEHVYTAYTLKEVQAKLTEVLITQCPTASSTTASSTTAASTTAASTTASSTTPATTTASSTTPATTTASSTTPASTTARTSDPTACDDGFTVTEQMDTGGTELSALGPIVNGVQRPLVEEFIGWIWNPDQNRWGFVGQNFAPLFLDLHSTVEGSWSLTDCKSACNEETLCGGFTFIGNPAVPSRREGVCHFKQINDIVLDDIPPDIENKNLYSAYRKCTQSHNTNPT